MLSSSSKWVAISLCHLSIMRTQKTYSWYRILLCITILCISHPWRTHQIIKVAGFIVGIATTVLLHKIINCLFGNIATRLGIRRGFKSLKAMLNGPCGSISGTQWSYGAIEWREWGREKSKQREKWIKMTRVKQGEGKTCVSGNQAFTLLCLM